MEVNVAQLPHRDFIEYLAGYADIESFLEVGVRDGDSTLAALKGSPLLKDLALCDTWGNMHGGTGKQTHEHVQAKLAGFTGTIDWLDGPSHLMLPTLTRNFHMVHIDGDHSESGALNDLRLGWGFTEWVLVCHDIYMPAVWTALSIWLCEVRDEINEIQMSAADFGTLAVWRILDHD